jgi:hypothetical protein
MEGRKIAITARYNRDSEAFEFTGCPTESLAKSLTHMSAEYSALVYEGTFNDGVFTIDSVYDAFTGAELAAKNVIEAYYYAGGPENIVLSDIYEKA